MRNLSLALAVAGVLASAAASAAPTDLYIGGASAQSAFWKADFGTSVCGGPANVTTYVASGVSNEAWRCNATAAVGTGISAGDQVTVHYNSQFGTISGVAPLLKGAAIPARLFVNPDSANCPAVAVGGTSTCTVPGYDQTTESPGTGTALVPSPNSFPIDVAVLDMEIKFWGQPQNWATPVIAAFGAAPTSLATPVAPTVVNGQIFTVIANNGAGSPFDATVATPRINLSKASLAAIFTGVYNVWGDVPEVGGGNATAIKVCRREQGSGTQVAASVFFSGLECGYSATSLVSAASPGALGANVSEEVSTGNVRTCVQGTAGAIGVTSLGTNAGYATLNIDGVQANAHNAAAGMYPFAFEDVVYNVTTSAVNNASQGAKDLAALFITNARKATSLTSQIENTATQNAATGNWTATTRRSNYALPFLGVNTKSVANASTLTQAVTSLGLRNGDNCKVLFNSNTL